MKRINVWYIVALIAISMNYTYAQELKESQVPEKVRTGFKKLYPDTYVHEWEYNKKKQCYEAEFVLKGSKYESYFTSEGKWIRTERDMHKNDVPKTVLSGLDKTEYAGWKIDDVKEQQNPEHKLIYVLEVEKGKQEIYLYFLPNGELLKTARK